MNPQGSFRLSLRTIMTIAMFGVLLALIFVQQGRIRKMERGNADAAAQTAAPINHRPSAQAGLGDGPPAVRVHRRQDDLIAGARNTPTEESVANQLAEISAPLQGDMASTMFNADVKQGQSVVTGGYQTADGRNQFTILKPRVVTDRNGKQQIEIDSNLVAMSQEDTRQSGLDSLATNARNTLQHAESWEESDVSGTMELIRNSTSSEHLGQPKTVVEPGGKFSIEMTSDDRSSYTLSGTAELSPDGSGVVLKARIEQKDSKD